MKNVIILLTSLLFVGCTGGDTEPETTASTWTQDDVNELNKRENAYQTYRRDYLEYSASRYRHNGVSYNDMAQLECMRAPTVVDPLHYGPGKPVLVWNYNNQMPECRGWRLLELMYREAGFDVSYIRRDGTEELAFNYDISPEIDYLLVETPDRTLHIILAFGRRIVEDHTAQ